MIGSLSLTVKTTVKSDCLRAINADQWRKQLLPRSESGPMVPSFGMQKHCGFVGDQICVVVVKPTRRWILPATSL